MNPGDEGQIELITRQDQNESRTDRVRLVSKTLDVSELRDRFEKFMNSLQSIIAVGEDEGGPFRLSEIQFSAEITGNGEFKLLGTGVGIEASSAVTFVLQRDRGDEQAHGATGQASEESPGTVE